MIQPLDLLLYIAITVALSVAIGTYIGVALILSGKVYGSLVKRTGYQSPKPDLFEILALIVMLSPLVGTGIYLVSLTAAN